MKDLLFSRKHKKPQENDEAEDQALGSKKKGATSSATNPDELSVSLRAEMLPSSEIAPDLAKFRWSALSPLKIGAIIGLIILLGLSWIFSAGPGRPILEDALAGMLRVTEPTITPTAPVVFETEVVFLPTKTVRATNTPTITPRPIPTATETVVVDTPTSEPTPKSVTDCVDVLAVTIEDVGKTMCVRGVILNFEERPSGFLMAFSNKENSMYWVSYDLVWKPAEEGLCVEVTGEVMQIADTPIIIFGYNNLPVICSSP